MRDEAKKHANTRFEKSPRLKAAVEELVEAIKEEAKRLTDEDKKE
jgi:gas vesicle protein